METILLVIPRILSCATIWLHFLKNSFTDLYPLTQNQALELGEASGKCWSPNGGALRVGSAFSKGFPSCLLAIPTMKGCEETMGESGKEPWPDPSLLHGLGLPSLTNMRENFMLFLSNLDWGMVKYLCCLKNWPGERLCDPLCKPGRKEKKRKKIFYIGKTHRHICMWPKHLSHQLHKCPCILTSYTNIYPHM